MAVEVEDVPDATLARLEREAREQVAAWRALADPEAGWPTETTADEILRARAGGSKTPTS